MYAISQTHYIDDPDYIQIFSLMYAYSFIITYAAYLIYVMREIIIFQIYLSKSKDQNLKGLEEENQIFVALHMSFVGGLEFKTLYHPIYYCLE